MSQSYSDFEQDYNTHLSKVRSFLARSSTSTQNIADSNTIATCEQSLQSAKQCIHAMQGLAEIEGDPFKAEEAKRKLERDIGPLELEMKSRKRSGISAVFKRGNNSNNRGGQSSDENYLFNNRVSYAPPSINGGGNSSIVSDLEMGDDMTTPMLTSTEQSISVSEQLLRETQALCAESEQIGAGTLETMGRQREQIDRSGGFILQSIENTEQAKQIMKHMARRALNNKIFLYCVIGLLLVANGVALLHLWRRKN